MRLLFLLINRTIFGDAYNILMLCHLKLPIKTHKYKPFSNFQVAALQQQSFGLVDNWLRHIQDIIVKHQRYLDTFATEQERLDKLCELNVMEQVFNVCENTLVRNAWQRGQKLSVHGWIYGVEDGLLRDLALSLSSTAEMKAAVHRLLTQTQAI